MRQTFALGACAALLALAPAAQALDIGGLQLDESGFADVLLGSAGSYTTWGGVPLAASLTDGSLATWAQTFDAGAWVELGFTDNVVVNGAGDDIALFEQGHEAYDYSQEGFDSFVVTINGVSRTYFTTETTTIVEGYNVNMTKLDLSFFGIADGATIDRLHIGMDFDTRGSRPQLQLVAAIHTAPIPEPATWALFAAGAAALALRRRPRA